MNLKVLEKQKGITLVSLVVTIVILIIIAGVTISMTIGSNGIITRAQEAKDATKIAQIKEDIRLDILYSQIDTNGANISQEKIEKIISKYGKLEDDKDTITTNEGYKLSLKDIYSGSTGNGNTGDSSQDSDKIAQLEEKIKKLESENSTLQQEKLELSNNITSLQKELNNLKASSEITIKPFNVTGSGITYYFPKKGYENVTKIAYDYKTAGAYGAITIPTNRDNYTIKITNNTGSSKTLLVAMQTDSSGNGNLLFGSGGNNVLENGKTLTFNTSSYTGYGFSVYCYTGTSTNGFVITIE